MNGYNDIMESLYFKKTIFMSLVSSVADADVDTDAAADADTS